jgi:hypothetical protein
LQALPQLRWLHFRSFCSANLVLQPANLFCGLLSAAMALVGLMRIIRPVPKIAVITIALPRVIQSAMPSAAVMLEAHAVLQAAATASLLANQLVLIQPIMLPAVVDRQLIVVTEIPAALEHVFPALLLVTAILIALTLML